MPKPGSAPSSGRHAEGKSGPPRYRIEDGKTCIDIKLTTAHQLFDGRDPAPFRGRDLDEDAVEYIVEAVSEIPPTSAVKIVFFIAEDSSAMIPATTIVEAVRAHFTYEVIRAQSRVREHLRHARLTLLVGLSILAGFLSLAELTLWLPASHLRQLLHEGLVITSWVAMWRPLELLLYDWWPLVRHRRLRERVLQAELMIVYGRL